MNHINYYQVDLILFKNGDESALPRIWKRIKSLVKIQINGMFPTVHPESVCYEEMLSNSYLAVWRSAKSFIKSRNKNFTTLAMFAVRNAILDVSKVEFKYTDNMVSTETFAEESFTTLDMLEAIAGTSAWGWVPMADAHIIYIQLTQLLFRELEGNSFTIMMYKRLGELDRDIRKALCMSHEHYKEAVDTLRKEVSYILLKENYNFGVLNCNHITR